MRYIQKSALVLSIILIFGMGYSSDAIAASGWQYSVANHMGKPIKVKPYAIAWGAQKEVSIGVNGLADVQMEQLGACLDYFMVSVDGGPYIQAQKKLVNDEYYNSLIGQIGNFTQKAQESSQEIQQIAEYGQMIGNIVNNLLSPIADLYGVSMCRTRGFSIMPDQNGTPIAVSPRG